MSNAQTGQAAEELAFVFGFGSLVDEWDEFPGREPSPNGYLAELTGYGRRWDIAMDNRATLPGYKYYLDPSTGERPAIFVTFINLYPCPGVAANGFCVPTTLASLDSFDERERNYERTDITGLVEPRTDHRVFAYVGTREARERYARGLAEGSAVVDKNYLLGVEDGFAKLGSDELNKYRETTDQPQCPIRELIRVDLPPTVPAEAS